jgi:phage gpG-like protein
MNASQFPQQLRAKAKELERYANTRWPGMAARKVLRFIDGNFRAQGWQGATFEAWKPNARRSTILIRRGHLRRSWRQQTGPGMVRTYSTSPYAAMHNRGYRGTVTIKAHERRKYAARKIGTGKFTKSGRERMKTVHDHVGNAQVREHVRTMNIPKRQMAPNSPNDSPVLVKSILRDMEKEIKNIFSTL